MNVHSEMLANFLACRPRKINIIVELFIIEINSRKLNPIHDNSSVFCSALLTKSQNEPFIISGHSVKCHGRERGKSASPKGYHSYIHMELIDSFPSHNMIYFVYTVLTFFIEIF